MMKNVLLVSILSALAVAVFSNHSAIVNLDSNNPEKVTTEEDTYAEAMSSQPTASNICPSVVVNLDTLHTDTLPAGVVLVWSTDSVATDGLDTILADMTAIATSGTYYVYYADTALNCYGPGNSIIVTITGCNTSPIAIDDIASTQEGSPVNGNVLTNDDDLKGDDLTVTTTPINPIGGTVTIDSAGNYTFTPDPGFTGEGSFSYEVCDDGVPQQCDTATVVIEVIDNSDPNNNPPTGVEDNFVMENDNDLTGDLLSTDSDPDGDNLTITTTPVDNPTTGTLTINPDGTFTYEPDSTFTGEDSFKYEVCDDGTPIACDTVEVTIEILEGDGENDIYATDDASTGDEGAAQTGNVTDNDNDPEGDNLTAAELEGPANGTLTLNTDGSYTYTPDSGFTGNDQFTYKVCDNGSPQACDSATVYLTVLEVQEPPLVLPNPLTIPQDSTGTICMPILDLNEGDTFTSTLCTGSPSNGTATPSVNGNELCITYTPDSGYNGTDEICVIVCDQTGLCDTVDIPVTIVPELLPIDSTQPPVVIVPLVVIPEDSTVTVCAPIVDANVEDTHSVTICEQPQNGTATASVDNSNNTLCLTIEPDNNFTGTDSVCVIVCDQTGLCDTVTIAIEVIDSNDPPLAIDDIATTQAGSPVTGNVLTNDDDPEDDNLAVTTTPINPIGGTVTIDSSGNYTFTPDPGFTGDASFSYEVCDDGSPQECDTATVVINVIDNSDPGNNAPTGVEDNFVMENDNDLTGDLLSTDSDPDGDNLTITTTPVEGPSEGTLTINPDGTFTYEPDSTFTGEDSFKYEVCDDATPKACDTVEVTIEILEGDGDNDIYATDDVSTGDGGKNQTGNVTDNDNDPEGDNLTVTELEGPTNGSLTLNSDGSYTYTPDNGFTGNDQFVYKVCDDGTPQACDSATVYLTVLEVQEPPLVLPNPLTIPQDSTGTICMPILDLNEGDTFTSTLCTGSPENGTATPTVNGNQLCIEYTPDSGHIGSDEVCVIVCDQTGLCETVGIPVTVVPQLQPIDSTQPPVVIVPLVVIPEDSTVAVCAPIVDANVEETHSVTICEQPQNGTATASVDNSNNTLCLTIEPDNNFTGTDSVCVIVCDQTGLCDTVTIPIKVLDTNDPPLAIDDISTTQEGSPTTGNGLTNDDDPEGDELTVSTTPIDPIGGNVTIDSAGNYTFTPDPDFTGEGSFSYEVCDDGTPQECDTATVVINVIDNSDPDNNAPTGVEDNFVMENDNNLTGDLLSNDSDPDGDNLAITMTPVESPTAGTLTINADGTFTYEPDSTFTGEDSFKYEVCDDASPKACDTVEVTIVILEDDGDNDIYATDDASTGDEGTTQSGNVTDNDNDPEGGDLTVTELEGPTNGTLTLTSDGSYTYTPDAGFTGNDQFTYMVCDDGSPQACDSATVYFTVLESPMVCADIQGKVYLEGAIVDPDEKEIYLSEMRPDLNDLRLLPGQAYSNTFLATTVYQPAGQPYNVQPWLYNGDEGDNYDGNGNAANGDAGYPTGVVDWVLVSLRDSVTDTGNHTVCQKAGLLMKDGSIDFSSNSNCCTIDNRKLYYLVIEHRNHLLVMSDTALVVEDSTITYDFTTQDSYRSIDPNFNAIIGFGQKEISSGVFVMFAGNAEQKFTQDDTDITVDDEVIWRDQNSAVSSHNLGDFNLNGDVNFNDRIIWELNNGKFSSVPRDANQ